jgi:hypothetical protein
MQEITQKLDSSCKLMKFHYVIDFEEFEELLRKKMEDT